MQAAEIVKALSKSSEWMVLFRLDAIRRFADEARIKSMYFLPQELDLQPYSHVVLTSAGRFLAPVGNAGLLSVVDGVLETHPTPDRSLYDTYERQLRIFSIDEADCIGLGQKPPLPPVLLQVNIEGVVARARTLLRDEPSQVGYDLLRAVGVEYEGGHREGDSWVAFFSNRLPAHLHAGALSGFSRTGGCNEFFLNHCEIGEELEAGLLRAAQDRMAAGKVRGFAASALLARRACREPLAMVCQPPPPDAPFPYGDLVPLGFVLRALNRCTGATDALRNQLCDKLANFRQDGLWAFHTGRLVTATDTALVLQGFADQAALEALERFADGNGAYYPQLGSRTAAPGRMTITDANRHWCQPDFATTCLIRALRHSAQLPCRTPLSYLEEWFDRRSGLYFANPYLVDWVLAQAIQGDPLAGPMRRQLQAEILAGMNADHSFGGYDPALSTALAIVALAALGYRGRRLLLSQLRLLDLAGDFGLWPESIPFYSTLAEPEDRLDGPSAQFVEIGGRTYALSFYRDAHRMIGTALAALALDEGLSDPRVESILPATRHPRYRCDSPAEYVAKFALPPYLTHTGAELRMAVQ